MSKRLRAAFDAVSEAESAAANVLREEYPVGRAIHWQMGEKYHAGVVISHGYGDRIKVQNGDTGKEYWIYAYRVDG